MLILILSVMHNIVDDGSSTIACIEFIPDDTSSTQQGNSTNNSASKLAFTHASVLNKFNISELVRISGIINEYKERKEIKIRHMSE